MKVIENEYHFFVGLSKIFVIKTSIFTEILLSLAKFTKVLLIDEG